MKYTYLTYSLKTQATIDRTRTSPACGAPDSLMRAGFPYIVCIKFGCYLLLTSLVSDYQREPQG